jgi:adenosylcobinamide-GDP ribazoletransferase
VSLTTEIRAAGCALSFLTRVPVPVDFDGDDVRRAGAYFPLVGAGIGALSRRTPAPLLVETLLTGALHLDALADSADALGSSDRERALEIMRDSRIGSFGAAAIVLDLLLKNDARHERWITAGALSRTVPVVLGAALPYARASGTGAATASGSPARAAAAVVIAIALTRDRRALAKAAGVTLGSGLFWHWRIGGVTGDTLGASIEITETLLLQ